MAACGSRVRGEARNEGVSQPRVPVVSGVMLMPFGGPPAHLSRRQGRAAASDCGNPRQVGTGFAGRAQSGAADSSYWDDRVMNTSFRSPPLVLPSAGRFP